jgi:hypothetical protein
MDRREALKSLTALAGVTGMTVTPVTAADVETAELVILKANVLLSEQMKSRLSETWSSAVSGTGLEHIKVLVLDGDLDVQFVKSK